MCRTGKSVVEANSKGDAPLYRGCQKLTPPWPTSEVRPRARERVHIHCPSLFPSFPPAASTLKTNIRMWKLPPKSLSILPWNAGGPNSAVSIPNDMVWPFKRELQLAQSSRETSRTSHKPRLLPGYKIRSGRDPGVPLREPGLRYGWPKVTSVELLKGKIPPTPGLPPAHPEVSGVLRTGRRSEAAGGRVRAERWGRSGDWVPQTVRSSPAACARTGTAFPIGLRGGAPPAPTAPARPGDRPPRHCRLRRRCSRPGCPASCAFERRREAASTMARLERLLCVLVLVLCGAPSPGLCVPRASTSKKPIIGKKAGREPRACGRVSVLGPSRCWVPAVASRLRNTGVQGYDVCLHL